MAVVRRNPSMRNREIRRRVGKTYVWLALLVTSAGLVLVVTGVGCSDDPSTSASPSLEDSGVTSNDTATIASTDAGEGDDGSRGGSPQIEAPEVFPADTEAVALTDDAAGDDESEDDALRLDATAAEDGGADSTARAGDESEADLTAEVWKVRLVRLSVPHSSDLRNHPGVDTANGPHVYVALYADGVNQGRSEGRSGWMVEYARSDENTFELMDGISYSLHVRDWDWLSPNDELFQVTGLRREDFLAPVLQRLDSLFTDKAAVIEFERVDGE